MSYEPNVNTWTDPLGDTHTVNLQPIITVPVSVWVANAQLVAAQNDVANANLLYNQNNVGRQRPLDKTLPIFAVCVVRTI